MPNRKPSLCSLLLSLSTLSTVLAASLLNEQVNVIGQRLRRTAPQSSVDAVDNEVILGHQLSWDGIKPASHMEAFQHESLALSCQAGGSPPPTIHWLKNGKPIIQEASTAKKSFYEETGEQDLTSAALTSAVAIEEEDGDVARLGMSSTRSRLFLDCLTSRDSAIYTCVAETPFQRISTDTKLIVSKTTNKLGSSECVEKRKGYGKPARITMWTNSRIELSGSDVKLFCRASGSPVPTISWSREDDAGLQVIHNDYRHKILANGDLIIRKVNFDDDMGGFVCIAQNNLGSDRAATFLYPTFL